MQGTIAQTLGLAIHGNAFLRGLDNGPFWPDATFFRYCRSVRFMAAESGQGGGERLAAADPDAWLRALRSRCLGLRVRVERRGEGGFGERMTVGFVGGGSRWLIEELGGNEPFAWSDDDWSVTHPAAEDKRVWSVVYRGAPDAPAADDPADLDSVERDLRVALQGIAPFAERIGSDFAGAFRRALACLDSGEACASTYHPDLAPAGLLSPRAKCILGACETGWVFGGMGSWNDGAYGSEDAGDGDPLSQALFDALQAALASVANSTAPAGTQGMIASG
ncbi:MAG: hypothetical protein QOG72_2655 [Sphingomonadales bacterium]|nr:hypothetical protein [Sphingomonadales bacterium]